ncbi:hypothetical protein MRB53_031521 [Persea americana]|uniref:Uncharacterized protein n=1 Tax=Persea americana TaxID=3435 RepID=A0ACC2KPB7_PERAE|nr:hypothetical protein MRB53_031521 [Persea americana]
MLESPTQQRKRFSICRNCRNSRANVVNGVGDDADAFNVAQICGNFRKETRKKEIQDGFFQFLQLSFEIKSFGICL